MPYLFHTQLPSCLASIMPDPERCSQISTIENIIDLRNFVSTEPSSYPALLMLSALGLNGRIERINTTKIVGLTQLEDQLTYNQLITIAMCCKAVRWECTSRSNAQGSWGVLGCCSLSWARLNERKTGVRNRHSSTAG